MSDATFNSFESHDNEYRFGIHADEPTPAAKKLRKNKGWGSLLFNRTADIVKSKKTHDFLIGAGISGSISMAARMSVIGGATVLGFSAASAAIPAAVAAGMGLGVYRYYKETKAERDAGTYTFDKKKFLKQFMYSTALSSIGGTGSYLLFHVYNEEAANLAVKTLGVAKDFGARALEGSLPGSTKVLAAAWNGTVATGAAIVSATPGFVSNVVSETGSGLKSLWGALKSKLPGFEKPQIVTADNTTVIEKTPSMAGAAEARIVPAVEPVAKVDLAQEKGWSAKGDRLDIHEASLAKQAEDVQPRLVKSFHVDANGAMTPYVKPVVEEFHVLPPVSSEDIALQFNAEKEAARIDDIIKSRAGAFDVADAGVKPYTYAGVPSLATAFTSMDLNFDPASVPKYNPDMPFAIYSEEVSPELTAGIRPGQGVEFPVGEKIPEPRPAPLSSEKIASFFEGEKLTKGEKSLLARAMAGDSQAMKDLGLSKKLTDEEAVALMRNAANLGNKQAAVDMAYWEHWGKKGLAADPKGSLETMRELAEGGNKAARGFVREWTGEKAEKVASGVKRAMTAAASGGDNVKIEMMQGQDGTPYTVKIRAKAGVLKDGAKFTFEAP